MQGIITFSNEDPQCDAVDEPQLIGQYVMLCCLNVNQVAYIVYH